ncbi:MAG TPA: carboxypeptidase-like regulatory domain-containing protein [Candidatus Binatus sp.]|nr:carboxypeptidase-like regulatory domain-containing protein [Candidatus Binatus sp.]
MNGSRDFDRIASTWLAEGPEVLADRVLDGALREIHRTRQRRRPWTPWRTFAMAFQPTSALARVAAAIVIGAVALGGAGYLLTPRAGTGGPGPSASQPSIPPATPTTAPTAHPTRTISGRVVDSAGTPVVGATVSAPGHPDTATTDADGRWTMAGLDPAGTYCLELAAIVDHGAGSSGPVSEIPTTLNLYFGRTGATLSIDRQLCVGPGGDAVANVSLLPLTPVSGTVVTASGQPLPVGSAGERLTGFRVNGIAQVAGADGWGQAVTQAGPSGRFTLWLPAGPWRLWTLALQGTTGSLGTGPDIVVGSKPITGIVFRFDGYLASPGPS